MCTKQTHSARDCPVLKNASWCLLQRASQCHGESGIPELLYPHTKFPSEYCTPVHDSLVNPVRGYHIRVVN